MGRGEGSLARGKTYWPHHAILERKISRQTLLQNAKKLRKKMVQNELQNAKKLRKKLMRNASKLTKRAVHNPVAKCFKNSKKHRFLNRGHTVPFAHVKKPMFFASKLRKKVVQNPVAKCKKVTKKSRAQPGYKMLKN